jgi:restriction endonuclease S subunit
MSKVKTDLKIDLNNLDKSDWKTYRFDEIAKNISERVDPNNTELTVYIGLEHLDSESLDIKRNGTPDDVNGTKLKFYKGDIIFGRRRAYQRKAGIATTDGFCSAHALVLRANPDVIDPELFPFFLHSDLFMNRAVDISAGSLSPTINWGTLKRQVFLLPPLEMHSKLSKLLCVKQDLLNAETVLIDSESTVLKSFVEDTIHGRFFNDAGIESSKMGQIPSDWNIVNFEDVVKVTDGAHHTPTYTDKGVPFLRVTDIQNEIIDFKKTKYVSREEHLMLIKRCHPEKGDVLYSKNGTIGISKIVDWDWEFSTFVSLALFKIKNKEVLNVDYFKLLLDSVHIKKEIHRRSKQGTVTNLHLEEIRLFRIPLPPFEKQVAIATRVKSINQSISSAKQKLVSSKSLKKALLNRIF